MRPLVVLLASLATLSALASFFWLKRGLYESSQVGDLVRSAFAACGAIVLAYLASRPRLEPAHAEERRADPPEAEQTTNATKRSWRVAGFLALSAILVLFWVGGMKFARLSRRSASKGSLGSLEAIRSALNLYYDDWEGTVYPDDPHTLTVNGKYLREIPELKTLDHRDSRRIITVSSREPRDTGQWAYVRSPGGRENGQIFIDCTHTDIKGNIWASY